MIGCNLLLPSGVTQLHSSTDGSLHKQLVPPICGCPNHQLVGKASLTCSPQILTSVFMNFSTHLGNLLFLNHSYGVIDYRGTLTDAPFTLHRNSESSQVDVGCFGHSWVPCNRKSIPPIKYPMMSMFLPVSVSDVVLSTEAEL